MSAEHALTIPLSVPAIEPIEAGDLVYFTGPLFTARPRWYQRILDEGRPVPVDLQALGANVLLHAGPVMRRTPSGEWEMAAMVPMPDWIADGAGRNVARILDSLDLRALIGKGELQGSAGLCQRHQCLHLITFGTWNNFARRVRRVRDVAWLELGLTEAMWVFDVDRMGPFVVETDIHGHSLYAQFREERERRIQAVLQAHGLDTFRYSTPGYPVFLRRQGGGND
jgi:L(+)-tartrate dehydratase beta subunit